MTEFLLNDEKIIASEPDGMPLLEFIRRKKHLHGSKLVCGEGECGACTVLVGELNGEGVFYKSMTACIMPLANASGKHIVTIEGLNLRGLSPVQNALVAANGTQCGFCTPGFVVSLSGVLLNGDDISFDSLMQSIDGNICRCTGYKSIERAVKDLAEPLVAMTRSPHERLIGKRLPPRQLQIGRLIDLEYLPAYFKEIPLRLLQIAGSRLREAMGSGQPVAGGGTDLYVQQPDQLRDRPIAPFFDVSSLQGISLENGQCEFGAAMTMGDLYRSTVFREALPDSGYIFRLLSSTQIRNMATIGGNLANASPIGDFTILLLALDADLTLVADGKRRRIKLKDFYLGYKITDRAEGEYIEKIRFRALQGNERFNFEKVSQRRRLDVAGVNSACRMTFGEDRVLKEIHLSAGGVGPIPLYLDKTCRFLQGKKPDEAVLKEAVGCMLDEISPISDTRGSARYKTILLRQLLYAHFFRMYGNRFQPENWIGHDH